MGGLRGGEGRKDLGELEETACPDEQVFQLFDEDLKLVRVFYVLVLAAAAASEVLAERLLALRGRLYHFQKVGEKHPALFADDLDAHLFTFYREGHENDKIVEPSDRFAAEGVVDEVED